MIISRTPLRASFVGGGSDFPGYYRQFGGAVVSTAIDKYVYVTVNRKFDNGIRVSYSRTEEAESVDKIGHAIVRSAMRLLNLSGGVEITTIADIPSRGTGLGSSSSFTVGLLNVLSAFQGKYVSSSELSEKSCHVEIDLCGAPIGKQDQYAAAFGGLNLIEFQQDDRVDVTPIIMPAEAKRRLERKLITFYTGVTRNASAILRDQSDQMESNSGMHKPLRRMVELAHILRSELQAGNLDSFGQILHENWELKKSLTDSVSTQDIDHWYQLARDNGASGGKLLGAGGGGFLLFYADESRHEAIERALKPLRRFDLGFESLGSRIIFYNE